tara:strand:+ start:368 stop:583 length:216 start_codon:yes stop_codon:yes gene_type:complete
MFNKKKKNKYANDVVIVVEELGSIKNEKINNLVEKRGKLFDSINKYTTDKKYKEIQKKMDDIGNQIEKLQK